MAVLDSKDSGKLAIITAPSGAGQDTVIKLFITKHPEWWLNAHVTTRNPRPGEVDGQDMIFLTEEEFLTNKAAGDFIETFKAAGNWRGTLKRPIEKRLLKGQSVIVRPDHNGAAIIKEQYPKAMTIFLNAENRAEVEERLRTRGTESETEVSSRLAWNKEKLAHANEYDHVVINPEGHPEKAVADLERILVS